MDINGNVTDADKTVLSKLLSGEAQAILSEATKGIPLDIWKAIALAEQSEPPVPVPSYIYTSSGTMGMSDAISR